MGWDGLGLSVWLHALSQCGGGMGDWYWKVLSRVSRGLRVRVLRVVWSSDDHTEPPDFAQQPLWRCRRACRRLQAIKRELSATGANIRKVARSGN